MRIFDGKQYRNMTAEEITAMEAEQRKHKIHELTRPRTIDEGMMELNRVILAEKLADTEDKTLAIACMAFFEPWTPGVYAVGDIRANPETGYPRECMVAHDTYKNGEYMIWTDYNIYKCVSDTNFSPADYPAAWEKEES